MSYRDFIEGMRAEWIGRRVLFDGKPYTVTGVDYNGALLIDKPAQYTKDTAVAPHMVEVIR